MLIFTCPKPNFIKLFLLFIVLLTSSINIAQTKEKMNIDSKAKELGITTTELQGILNSALRNGDGGYSQPDTLTNIILTGQAANDRFGWSVSTAGDVNGDGYSDIIVGAPGSGAGRAYIYFGGTSMDNIADVTMTGEAASDGFGGSVSRAGDVNGDRYSDVIVGAPYNDAGEDEAGRSYIYFGGTSMDNIADVTMTGEAADDRFGISVSTAGDVNGDGYSDVIVGANWNDAGGEGAGRSYIYLGGTSMDNSADVTMTGEAAYDNFSFSVSTAGDVNRDGYSDVIVGAYTNNAGGAYAGRAYIYFGGISMDNIADVIMTGEATSDGFGGSVSTAGDVNGDRYSDVIVGASLNDAGGTMAGRAYIYFIYQSGSYVEVDVNIINNYLLRHNYPNPFNPTTKIKYQIPQLSFVTLKIYDVLGSEVALLVQGEKSLGSYQVEFNATGLPSGVYFYRLQAGNFVETKKMVLMK
jgi:hypothetical protein